MHRSTPNSTFNRNTGQCLNIRALDTKGMGSYGFVQDYSFRIYRVRALLLR